MLIDIEDILKPYEDSQSEVIKISNPCIERIPMIVDPSTGMVTHKFQNFYDKIVDSVLNTVDWGGLHAISDKVISDKAFRNMFRSRCGDIWDRFISAKDNARGIDIELNLSRFNQIHRNLIGGFYVIIYMIEEISNDITITETTQLKQYKTEILFTYRDGEFKILSTLSPFTEEE